MIGATHEHSRDASLHIAGVHLAISSDQARIETVPDPAYGDFVGAGGGPLAPADIRVRLEPGEVPQRHGLPLLCDTGESWSMFRDGAGYLLRLDVAAFGGEPFWLARFDRPATDVTVHCSRHLVTTRDGIVSVSSPVRYPLDQLLLMYHLAPRGGLLVHAAGAVVAGRGLVLAGRSGAGKSTICRLLGRQPGVGLLSDDRVAVRKIAGAYRAFGTPWPGEAGIACNRQAVLGAIVFLRQAAENRLVEITPRAACEALLPVTSIPWFDPEVMTEALGTCEDLTSRVPAFELHFTPAEEAADRLVELAKGLEGRRT